MKNFIYILLISFCISCDNSPCSPTFYFTSSEREFMAYNCSDSLLVKYTNSTNDSLNWISTYFGRFCDYDTVKDYEVFGANLCPDYYERWIVKVYPIDENLEYNSIETIKRVEIKSFKKSNDFNVSIQFSLNQFYSTFGAYPFVIDNKIVFHNDKFEVDGTTYSNVYTLIDDRKEVYDTLYYSPNIGFIKLITESGIYTFKNLN